jgi:subtilisin family serine protease
VLDRGPRSHDGGAWGGTDGTDRRVAVINSGIEARHPAVGGVQGYVAITERADESLRYDGAPHENPFGHGTACAGIIRSLARCCEVYTVRVLNGNATGRGEIFAAGRPGATEAGMHVRYLSLSTGRASNFGLFNELPDLAYFRHIPFIGAVNNVPRPSYPSLYAVMISVAAYEGQDPEGILYNLTPPIVFGTPGVDVLVAWKNGRTITVTGISFAAPHVAGLVTRLKGNHPGLMIFQVKTVLRGLAANVAAPDRGPSTMSRANTEQ